MITNGNKLRGLAHFIMGHYPISFVEEDPSIYKGHTFPSRLVRLLLFQIFRGFLNLCFIRSLSHD